MRSDVPADPAATNTQQYPTEFVDCDRCDGEGEYEDELWVWVRCYRCDGSGTIEVCAACLDFGGEEECDACGC